MIERLVLGAIAAFGIWASIDGMDIASREGDTPTEIAAADLQAKGDSAARFVRIPHLINAVSICNESWLEDSSKEKTTSTFENYVPVLSEKQVLDAADGKEVTTNAIAIYSKCDPLPESGDFIGLRDAGVQDIGDDLRVKFATSKVIVAKDAVVVRQGARPASITANIVFLALFAFALFCSVAPFFDREKWPTNEDLDHKDDTESLDAMFPILKTYKSLGETSLSEIADRLSDEKEDVLFKLNCEADRRPCLMVATDRRLILYRVQFQIVLRILSVIEQLFDKVPVVGGFISMLVTPFADTYRMFTAKDSKIYRQTMAYDDTELVSGKVPWKKRFDIPWSEIAANHQQVAAKKGVWSGDLKIEFMPRKLRQIFRKTPDVLVKHDVVLRALCIMAHTVAQPLERLGAKVEVKPDVVVIDMKDMAIAETISA